MNQPTENWLPVVGYEASYDVSDQGRVRSLARMDAIGRSLRGKLLKPGYSGFGYGSVSLYSGGKPRTHLVQHLVATAFHGPRPDGLNVCHNDGDPRNNRASNLRWDTQAANIQDVKDHGHHYLVNRTRCPRGHLLELPNLRASKLAKGARDCLACSRTRNICNQAKRPFSVELANEKYAAIMGGNDPEWRA